MHIPPSDCSALLGKELPYLAAEFFKSGSCSSPHSMYREEVSDEVGGHAQYLAEKIVMLDGTPKLEPDLSPPPADPRTMLENDINEERLDVKHYLKLAALADQAGLIDLKMKMEEQAADEAGHAEVMRRLLG